MRWTLILGMVLSVTSCTLLESGGGDDDDDDGGSGVGGGSGACGDFSLAHQQNAQLTYRYTDSHTDAYDIVGSWTVTTLAPSDGSYFARTRTELESEYLEDYLGINDFEYRCDDDGVRLVGYESETSYVSSGTDVYVEAVMVYREPYPLSLPASLSVGDGWTLEGTYDYSDSNGSSTSYSIVQAYEVVDQTSVTVPAGTFDAYQVVGTAEGAEAWTSWYAEGVGLIAHEDVYELVSVE